MLTDTSRAVDALHAIPPTIDHDTRARVGMAAKDAGVTFDDYDAWQSTNPRYNAVEVRSMWHSYDDGPVKAGTLYRIAAEHGWRINGNTKPKPKPKTAQERIACPVEQPRKPVPGMSAAEVYDRSQPAKNQHAYIAAKKAAGVPLDALRVVAAGDPLRIMGESMAGALVVPCMAMDGTLSTLQLIPPPDVAARLKAAGKPGKLNLPGHSVQGWFTVGELVPGGVVYIVEGIGTAWACWQATGAPAVVCFGAGNMGKVAQALRQQDDAARLVLVPDVGKESDAAKIAADVGAVIAAMPDGWEQNSDVNDLAQRDGLDVLALLLESATEPSKPEPRYKLLSGADIAALPPLAWRVRGVLPAVGLAGLYGPSASGKSFLAFEMAAAIADGRRWFDCRVESAPVVYAALEGEAGFKLRAQAWEAHNGRALPDGLRMMLQPFQLTNVLDVRDLAAVVPAGAVVFLDTLNRAAPTADENSSKDMGEILEAAKRLQSITGGLVVLVHHTGKDATKGLRGHSSLFAALDAAIEVSRDGDRREWKVAKSKDGADGDAHPFKLEIETLGIDAYGDPITSCTVRVDNNADDVKRVKVPQGGNQKLVYDGIRGLFKDGISGKPGAPPLRPCIELEAAVTAGAARLTCASDKKTSRAREAITGLVSRGVLGLNEGFLWTA
jgi:putative DNA primase/helicase|nr:AAA family ATPase [Rhodoferax sp.]